MGINSRNIAPMTDLEETEIREEYADIIISVGTQASGDILHLPQNITGTELLCNAKKTRTYNDHPRNTMGAWKRKEFACYPPGFKPICKTCLAHWRNLKERQKESSFDCEECDRGAVGLVKVEDSSLYLCRYHYRKARSEYGPAINESRLLPVGDADE